MMKDALLAALIIVGIIPGVMVVASSRGSRPPRDDGSRVDGPSRQAGGGPPPQWYSIEQAVSDQAQLHTIAFSALAETRLPLIKAFWRLRDGDLPPGSTGLDRQTVEGHAADTFALDADLSFRRARVYSGVAAAMGADTRERLAAMRFGSFFMKDIPAMGRDVDINTSATGDSGQALLEALTPEQRGVITRILDEQRPALAKVVEARRAIAVGLRKPMTGVPGDRAALNALGRQYGRLDGELSHPTRSRSRASTGR